MSETTTNYRESWHIFFTSITTKVILIPLSWVQSGTGMSKFVKKVKKAIQDKLNPDGSASGDEDIPLEYDADELRDTIKSFQDSPAENPPPPPASEQLWKSISAKQRVEEQIQKDDAISQYWMDQIQELVDKLHAAEEEGDTRKIGQYLVLLKQFAVRTKNRSLEKYVEDKQRDLFSQV